MTNEQTPAPKATMLLSGHCAFCPAVLDALSKMIKAGDIGELTVINLEQHPDAMQTYQVRSVPWVKIGNYELSGAQTLEALKQRAEWAKRDAEASDDGAKNQAAEFDFLLSDGQADKVIEAIKKDPAAIQAIMQLLGDPGTILSTRIGIGVLFEELANSDLLKSLIPQLGTLTQHEDPRIRADAYHYLGLSGDQQALPLVEKGLNDPDPEVKEIAADSLHELKHA